MPKVHGFLAVAGALLIVTSSAAAQELVTAKASEPVFAIPAGLHHDGTENLLPPGVIGQLGSGRLRQHRPADLFFSADGKILLSWNWYGEINRDSSIRFWDAATGREVRRIAILGNAPIYSIALAQDNKTLAVACANGLTLLVDAESAEVRMRLRADAGPAQGFYQLAFSPDGNLLATSNVQTDVKIWEVNTGKELRRFTIKQSVFNRALSDLAFLGVGKHIVGLGHLWEADTGRHLWPMTDQSDLGKRVITSDGRYVVTSASQAPLEFRERSSGKLIHNFLGQSFGYMDGPEILRLSPDGRQLADISHLRKVRVWDLASGKIIREIPPQDDYVPPCLALSPDGKTLAYVDQHSRIVLYDVPSGKERFPRTGNYYGRQGGNIALSPDGRWLAAIVGRATAHELELWDVASCKSISHAIKLEQAAGGFAYLPDGSTLVTCGGDGLCFWDASSGKHMRHVALTGPSRSGSFLACSHDGKVLAMFDGNKTAIVDTDSGKVIRHLIGSADTQYAESLEFSPDGRTLATVRFGVGVSLWDWQTGRLLRTLPHYYVGFTSFAPDGKKLALGVYRERGEIWFCDFSTGEQSYKQLPTAQNGIFLNVGRLLFGGGADNHIQLWEMATRGKRLEIPTHHGWIWHIAYATKSNLAVTAHEDGSMLVWDLNQLGKTVSAIPAKLSNSDLNKLWAELASGDASVAYHAVLELVARPSQSLPFLKLRLSQQDKRLQDLPNWLRDLDSTLFKVREQATKDLEKLGKLAEPALRKLLGTNPPPEVVLRGESLLAKVAAMDAEKPNSEWLAALRSVEVLERIGTKEALQSLQTLAATTPETWISLEARAALRRHE